jgi:DNA repair protein RadC
MIVVNVAARRLSANGIKTRSTRLYAMIVLMNYLIPMTMKSSVMENGSKIPMLIKQKLKIANTPERVSNIMTAILNNEDEVDRKKEHFWAIGTNVKLRIEYIDLVSLGTLSETVVHPREVFRYAIMKGVSSLILVHNHPSGDLTPSEQDEETTKKLKQAGDIIGINVMDHIIIDGEGNYYSFDQRKLLYKTLTKILP